MAGFDDVNFGSSSVPSISNDDVVRVLTGLNGKKPWTDEELLTYRDGSKAGDTKGGIERVLANFNNTGAVGYKDSKGGAVLTNVAIDSTGKEKPIAALLKAPEQTAESKGPTFVQGTDTRLQLFEGLKKLTASTDINEARALYNSIQQSLAEEGTRIEGEAYRFAESKFGIPEMLKQIESNRALDKSAEDYIPGMGDSPITQKVVEQTRELSGAARLDADSFLKRNLSYNSLKTMAANAERELRRIEANADRNQRIADAKADRQETFGMQAKLNQQIRAEDREARRQEEAQQIYNQLSATQIARITVLNAGEIEGLETEDARQRKIADLALGKGKDKKYQEAIAAETKEQLLDLALQGNGVARKLTLFEESARTGKSVEDIEAIIQSWSKRLFDTKMPEDVLTRNRKMGKEEKDRIRTTLKGAEFSSDPNKKLEANQHRLTLLREDMHARLQEKYLTDVDTWGTTDPILIKAISDSKRDSGQADVQNVFAAYMNEATGEVRKQRIEAWTQAMRNAADKWQGSVFGAPNWREAEALTVKKTVDLGIFAGTAKKLRDNMPTGTNAIGMGSVGYLPTLVEWAGRGTDMFIPQAKE